MKYTKKELSEIARQAADVEIYIAKTDQAMFNPHTDTIESTELTLDDIPGEVECNYYLMDQNDYNHSILANSSETASFSDWYGDKFAKVMVVILAEEPQ